MQNQKQYKEGATEGNASVSPEQKDGYENDFSVYNNIESNIFKTTGAEESIEAITEIIKADIEAFVQLIKDLLSPCNCDYIFTYANDSSRQGINPNYWTSFVRVIKRSGC